MRAICGALLGLVLAGAGGCPGINDAPKVSIKGPERVFPNQKATFEAVLDDRSQGAPRFEWILGDREGCPSTLELATGPGGGTRLGTERTVVFQETAERDHCLWVIASDSEGARAFATHRVTVKRRNLVVNGPTSVTSGQEVSYSASYTDDPGAVAQSTFFWDSGPTCEQAHAGAAAARGSATPATAPAPGGATWKTGASRKAFCVVVLAVDEFGFTPTAERAYRVADIVNGGPPASIRVVSPAGDMPFGIYSQVRLAAGAKGDLLPTDQLTFAWKLTPPGGASAEHRACPDAQPAGSEVCFQTVATGAYQVELAVTEGAQTANAAPFRLDVQDLPPCIRTTKPEFPESLRAIGFYDRDEVFTVDTIADDGDPWPQPAWASEHAFEWSVRRKGDGPAFRGEVNFTFRNYVIPARTYLPGDEVEVRVEYQDRVEARAPGSRPKACVIDDPLCEAKPGSGCTQRVTWTVVYL